MIHAIIVFSAGLSDEIIKKVCLNQNIKASRLDSTSRQWCLETEEAANFFHLGLNFQKSIEELYQ